MLVASVVTYNTPDSELKRCLSSLSDKIVCRIYVIDNSRSESTRRVCESDPRIFYIPSDNVGYGAAHNLAMRRSMAERADYHLVLNPDISFNPDRLHRRRPAENCQSRRHTAIHSQNASAAGRPDNEALPSEIHV